MTFVFAAIFSVACDLGAIFAEKSAWEEGAVDFAVENAKYGFTFASQSRDIVNCLKRGSCYWHGIEVWESRIYYGVEGAERIEMSLYNRGDDRSGVPMKYESLKKFLSTIVSKVKPDADIKNAFQKKLPSGGYSYTKLWDDVEPSVELSWGISSVKAKEMVTQFVRVTLLPKRSKRVKRAKKPVSGRTSQAKVKSNVTRNDQGDVWIQNVPMVDQGQKGYCAAAVAERVLRYYGHAIDEHEIAQMAGTESRGGTSVSRMRDTIREMSSKCRLGFQDVFSSSRSLKDISKEIEMYNKAAKSMDEEELSLADYTSACMINVGRIHESMKPKVLKKMRTKDFRYKKFLSSVKTQVDQGIPMIWGVTLGIFPEPGVPQSRGGHMRLIVGYNQKKKEILYSDTWGAGHELKRMPEDWAFAITHDAFFLRPL